MLLHTNRNEKQFREGLVFKARILVVLLKSSPKVIKKKKRHHQPSDRDQTVLSRSLIGAGARRNPATCGTNQGN